MKIKWVRAYPYDIPLIKPFKISLGTITHANNVIIEIGTNEGIIGYGEAAPTPLITSETQEQVLANVKYVEKLLINENPFNLERIFNKTNFIFAKGNFSLKAAIDMALYDIIGKSLNKPLYNILGGFREIQTDITLGIDKPKRMAKEALKHVEEGFKTLKVKVGTNPTDDIERIMEIRDAVGYDVRLITDANQAWSPKKAVKIIKAMEKFEVELVEQPVPAWNIEGLKYVKEKVDMLIAVDETVFNSHDAMNIVKNNAADVINIKLMKAGGIYEALKIISIAEAAGIRCMIGCMVESRLSLTAAAHLAVAKENIAYIDLDSFMFLKTDPVIGGMMVRNGRITTPESPGLGISQIMLKKY